MDENMDDEGTVVTMVEVPDEQAVSAQLKADIEDRKTFIGGSDAPVILGLSSWKSRFELYQEKIGEKAPDDLSDVERVQWGIILEDSVACMYMRRTGKKVRRVNKRIVDKNSSFPRVAQIDRRIVGGGILEIKTTDAANAGAWGLEGSADIPPHYYAQVQHQLAVMGETFAEVAVLVGGNHMKLYLVPRDDEFIQDMTDAELAFWTACKDRLPPEPITIDEAALRWGKAPAQPVQGTTIHGAIAAALLDVGEQRKALEAREDELKLQLQKAIADIGDTLMVEGKAVCTWKVQSRKDLDKARLLADHPEFASQYEKVSEFRVFRITKAAADFRVRL